MDKIENGNGECAKETTTRPQKKTTAEGHQRIPRSRGSVETCIKFHIQDSRRAG